MRERYLNLIRRSLIEFPNEERLKYYNFTNPSTVNAKDPSFWGERTKQSAFLQTQDTYELAKGGRPRKIMDDKTNDGIYIIT